MGNIMVGFLLPLLLLAAGLLNWSLISFIDLVISLLLRIISPKRGFQFRGRVPFLWCIIIYSALVVILQVVFLFLCAALGPRWSIADSWWMKLFGFIKLQSWRSPAVIFFIVIQLLAGLVAFLEVRRNSFGLADAGNSVRGNISSFIERIGYRLRLASCFLLPLVQLVVGICNPSWLSFPFFVCSCVGLVDWSLTSNFLGLFRWWKILWVYAGSYICLLYVYQLPLGFQHAFKEIADSIGLYQESFDSEWEEICSGTSLVAFYYMLSFVRHDLQDTEFIMSMRQGSLTERLLPSKNSFLVRQLRSGVRHTNILLRGNVFRFFSINWFTYGFPISLFALSYWSLHFASICSFGLLAYVGYILYACPSLFRLHHLNGLLLVFILLWAASTYIFNIAFTYVNWKHGKDMEIWEMVGLWHYPIPGFFLLAQFCLGIVVALGNLVNNSVFLCVSDEERQFSNGNTSEEVKEDTIVLIVATIAWLLRKCCRPILLALIFLIATKPGFVHAAYLIFFFIYLLSHDINTKMRQALVLLCEAHFAILYILQLDLVSRKLKEEGSVSLVILSQLGLLETQSSWDFLEITILACICAIYNHGFEMLFSFSAIVEHAPYPPIGFSILRAGLNKSVLLTVYATSDNSDRCCNNSHERRIASYLSAIGEQLSSLYRSFGAYIAFLTILFAVYLVRPNYVSFGYIFLLLLWIIGRQLVEMTKRRLWFPLKLYATVVFIFMYILSVFPSFEEWISQKVDLYTCFGYKTEASLLENLWDSLAILIVMQLYSYERRESKHGVKVDDPKPLQLGILGFLQRFLIWHSDKILFAALFYASLSPICAFGFLYLLGLIFCSRMPKTSKIPSKSFLIFTGFLLSAEYLFQMLGKLVQMFPGQKHHNLSLCLGLQVYEQSFAGREVGLRAKVLVIAACTLQYNVFHWLEKVPDFIREEGSLQEPCPLFISAEDLPIDFVTPSNENKPTISTAEAPVETVGRSKPSPSVSTCDSQSSQDLAATAKGANNGSGRRSLLKIWGTIKESHRWDKKTINALKQERFEMQKTTLKVYLKFWMENMFNLFGLEINMIALLLASFALLNAVSIFYIACLATCVLLACPTVRKLWPVFVFVQAIILLAEYFAMWKNVMSLGQRSLDDTNVHCHECWKLSSSYFNFCTKCWLGIIVDDPRLLISYCVVFLLACFKLRADRASCFSASYTYNQMISQHKNAFVWRDLSFETKSMWTFLDYLRVYCYCHLLDLVLALILITGTLEYDVLHFGYLGFALIFFRMRLTILKKKNLIFKYLRIYNFAVIVLSLAYQCPLVGDFNEGKCNTIGYIYEVIGFYKYDYGFRITSRSALVEIVIFVLISCQSYMFSSSEFDYVFRYLEAEQIGAIVKEQEKKAAWKTELLRHIREFDEMKRQRNLQVEKIKSEMLNLRIQLHDMDSGSGADDSALPSNDGLRRRRTTSLNGQENPNLEKKNSGNIPELSFPINADGSPKSLKSESPFSMDSKKHAIDYSLSEIKELEEHRSDSSVHDLGKHQVKERPLASAVQFIGDGVSQVQSMGNQAVGNIVTFFNISSEDSDPEEHNSSEDELPKELRSSDTKHTQVSSSSSSDKSSTVLQVRRIVRYMWSQIRSNNDLVCYCCFVLVFLWNFSFLSMVYLAGLYLYALCVNTGPNYIFWVIMLMYTELYILSQYLYQIMIQHCGFSIQSSLLRELGFPTKRIKSSFVISLLPLFLVYLFTLIQSSITAKDGEWFSIGFSSFRQWSQSRENVHVVSSWGEKAKEFFQLMKGWVKVLVCSCCRYWKSLTQEAESPPYFVQISMDVEAWPEDGIQPERIESGINHTLQLLHGESCKKEVPSECSCYSKVQVQSIEISAENENIALAVFEVLYASSSTDCRGEEQFNSLTPAADVAKEILKAQSLGFVEEVGFPYPIVSAIGGGRREIDLYAYIFGADLTVFFLVAIFYQSVIKNKSEFLEYYQLEDQFPIEYIVILMIIFFLIVVDRIIYLCSFATGKVIFYLFNLILFTYAVTEYAWNLDTSQHKTAGMALRAIYLTKAVSLALQAVQIRYGVPHQSTLYRQFLTSRVSQVNYLGYRVYRALPFLYELRCVLDWSCTSTSLTMFDWLKLEDINASLYLVNCDNVLNRAMHKPGEKQKKMTKFCNGIFLFLILILIIWAPMLMYSSGNPSNIANPINDVTFQLNIKTDAGRLTFYQTTLCERISWNQINSKAYVHLDPNHYLDSYDANDIQLICCQADSSTLWLVPDAVQKQFTMSLDTNTMDIKISWTFMRERPKGKEMVKYERNVDPWDLPKPSEVISVLNGSFSSFRVHNVYPRIFRVTGSGDVRPFEQEVNDVSVQLVLHQESSKWWSMHDLNSSNAYGGCGGLSGPMAIVASEETPQGFLGETLSKFSIWGLYITFVLAVGRFIRLQCSDLRMRIPYENLPSCDRLIAICEDIYAARAEGELGVEEVLYWTLIKIYRSPHMLLEYTKQE